MTKRVWGVYTGKRRPSRLINVLICCIVLAYCVLFWTLVGIAIDKLVT